MNGVFIITTFIILGVFVPINAFGFSLDKSEYEKGDTIVFSGNLEPGKFYTYQIFNPPQDNFAHFNMISPNPDGAFSDSFKADGQYWNLEGVYTLKLFDGPTILVEIPFDFSLPESIPKSKPSPPQESESPPEPKAITEKPKQPLFPTIQNQEPKTHIPGFPELDKSPQYYIDRYTNEQSYKDWFDSQFPGKLIEDIVGYSQTHIPGFPELDKSPQYYIDRYTNEQSYKDWFDSQFPEKSIYNVLRFPDPVAIPDWIKDIAEWWSTGEIDDETFVSGIEFMIENKIIIIPNLPESQLSDDTSVPSWVRNNANWWALDRISEDEFVNAIKFLVEKGIIVV